MNIIYYIANGLVLPPAMFFAYNFYKFRGSEIQYRKLWISITLISLTVVITSLKFVFPEIIGALERNKEALLAGEVWRLVSPLFIQPLGLWQCLFNGLFFIMFLPVGEYLYGRSILLIYFGAGLTGQLVNIYWNAVLRGGSSTALYGLMGALFMYILLNRTSFPRAYILIPIAGLIGATVLCFFKDGHAPSLLLGAVLGLALRRKTRVIPGNKEFPRKSLS